MAINKTILISLFKKQYEINPAEPVTMEVFVEGANNPTCIVNGTSYSFDVRTSLFGIAGQPASTVTTSSPVVPLVAPVTQESVFNNHTGVINTSGKQEVHGMDVTQMLKERPDVEQFWLESVLGTCLVEAVLTCEKLPQKGPYDVYKVTTPTGEKTVKFKFQIVE